MATIELLARATGQEPGREMGLLNTMESGTNSTNEDNFQLVLRADSTLSLLILKISSYLQNKHLKAHRSKCTIGKNKNP